MDPDTQLGPLTTQKRLNEIETLVEKTKKEGAPSFLVFSTKVSISFNLFWVVKGPNCVSGSIPLPIFNFFVFSTNKFINSSFFSSWI